MKYRILLLLLFFIASFATALHEVEHTKHHDSTNCQICIVNHLLLSGDIVAVFEEPQEVHFGKVFVAQEKSYADKTLFHYNNRAPPIVS